MSKDYPEWLTCCYKDSSVHGNFEMAKDLYDIVKDTRIWKHLISFPTHKDDPSRTEMVVFGGLFEFVSEFTCKGWYFDPTKPWSRDSTGSHQKRYVPTIWDQEDLHKMKDISPFEDPQ